MHCSSSRPERPTELGHVWNGSKAGDCLARRLDPKALLLITQINSKSSEREIQDLLQFGTESYRSIVLYEGFLRRLGRDEKIPKWLISLTLRGDLYQSVKSLRATNLFLQRSISRSLNPPKTNVKIGSRASSRENTSNIFSKSPAA